MAIASGLETCVYPKGNKNHLVSTCSSTPEILIEKFAFGDIQAWLNGHS